MTTEDLSDELHVRRVCDTVVVTAAKAMVEAGAPVEMILDRLLTYAAAQAVSIEGTRNTATVFRHLADNIEGGMFDHLDRNPEGKRH